MHLHQCQYLQIYFRLVTSTGPVACFFFNIRVGTLLHKHLRQMRWNDGDLVGGFSSQMARNVGLLSILCCHSGQVTEQTAYLPMNWNDATCETHKITVTVVVSVWWAAVGNVDLDHALQHNRMALLFVRLRVTNWYISGSMDVISSWVSFSCQLNPMGFTVISSPHWS